MYEIYKRFLRMHPEEEYVYEEFDRKQSLDKEYPDTRRVKRTIKNQKGNNVCNKVDYGD